MKIAFFRYCFLALLLVSPVALIPVSASFAADLETARAAYDRGNLDLAFTLYRECAERGDAEAEYAVGVLYHDGKGVPTDLQQAVQWVRKAAEQGLPEAQLCMGSFYFDGDGVKADYEAAVAWYLQAAKKGNVDAVFNMGFMYENGLGVELDCDRAREWYEKAAMQGDEEARDILEFFTCREYANVALLK